MKNVKWTKLMALSLALRSSTAQALRTGEITAHCGAHGADLMRPHCHIEDVTDLYCWLLDRPGHCCFNAGFDNMSVEQLARALEELTALLADTAPVTAIPSIGQGPMAPPSPSTISPNKTATKGSTVVMVPTVISAGPEA